MLALSSVVARLPARNDELAAPLPQRATPPDGIDRDPQIRNLPIARSAIALAMRPARGSRSARPDVRADAQGAR